MDRMRPFGELGSAGNVAAVVLMRRQCRKSDPRCNHGFHNDSTGRYDEKNAQLAWERNVAFFKQHLA